LGNFGALSFPTKGFLGPQNGVGGEGEGVWRNCDVRWRVQTGGEGLVSVSCASTSSCVATDGSGAFTFNSSSWSSVHDLENNVPLDHFGQPVSVSCPSVTLCIAVGSAGGVFTFNGTSWSTEPKVDTTGGFTAVSCPSTTFCMAVDNANRSFTFNGTSWKLAAVLTSGQGLDSGG
jgi:hypothetical protein